MNKRKKIIIIVTCVVAFYLIAGSVYAYVLHLEDDRIKSLFTEDAMDYLNDNDDFISGHGEVISLMGREKIPVETDQGTYMTFHCITREKELTVRVYGVYAGGWSYYYEIK